jgi:dihydroorotase
MVGESEEMRLMNPIDAVSVAEANRDLIVGITARFPEQSTCPERAIPVRSGIAFNADFPQYLPN